MTRPGSVVQAEGSTPQDLAAAAISRARAVAPTRRNSSQCKGIERDPPANCRPKSTGSETACRVRTLFQSASISSAMIMGMEVLTPCPTSGFLLTTSTQPSGRTVT